MKEKPLFNLKEYTVKNRRGVQVGHKVITGGGANLVAKEKRDEEEHEGQEAEATTS
jgi:hypothetical protein